MIYGALTGVIAAEAVVIIVLVVIIDRMVSNHLKMVRQQMGVPPDKPSSKTRVISPYKKQDNSGGDTE